MDVSTTVTVEGLDQFGNARGDVSSQAHVSISPENGCTNPASGPHVCLAHFVDQTKPQPYHIISAKVGNVQSSRRIAVVPKARS